MTSGLRGIGPTTRSRLAAVGVHGRDALERIGAVEAYRRLLGGPDGERVTRNALWALEAALLDIDWRDLPPARKGELLRELGATGSPDR